MSLNDCFKNSYKCDWLACPLNSEYTITLIKLRSQDGWQVRVNDNSIISKITGD